MQKKNNNPMYTLLAIINQIDPHIPLDDKIDWKQFNECVKYCDEKTIDKKEQ